MVEAAANVACISYFVIGTGIKDRDTLRGEIARHRPLLWNQHRNSYPQTAISSRANMTSKMDNEIASDGGS
jgi:hypothetical protein